MPKNAVEASRQGQDHTNLAGTGTPYNAKAPAHVVIEAERQVHLPPPAGETQYSEKTAMRSNKMDQTKTNRMGCSYLSNSCVPFVAPFFAGLRVAASRVRRQSTRADPPSRHSR